MGLSELVNRASLAEVQIAARSLTIISLAVLAAGCASEAAVLHSESAGAASISSPPIRRETASAAADRPAIAPPPPPAPAPAPAARAAPAAAASGRSYEARSAARDPRTPTLALESRSDTVGASDTPSTAPASAASAASAATDAEQLKMAKRQSYINSLKNASAVFNVVPPFVVDTPFPVKFWLDPTAEPDRLAQELKAELKKSLGENVEVEPATVRWAPSMRAKLTGAEEDFSITLVTDAGNPDETRSVRSDGRTEWSWDVRAKHPGSKQPLHLMLWSVLPSELGEPELLKEYDRQIDVDVTTWWLIDHYWEKYWKWLIGGLATFVGGLISKRLLESKRKTPAQASG